MSSESDRGPGPLDGLLPPPPPPELRARVLAAARVAAGRHTTAPMAWWLGAVLRAQPVWSAALIALLVAHMLVGSVLRGGRPTRSPLPRDREIAALPDLLQLTDHAQGDAVRPSTEPGAAENRRNGS